MQDSAVGVILAMTAFYVAVRAMDGKAPTFGTPRGSQFGGPSLPFC